MKHVKKFEKVNERIISSNPESGLSAVDLTEENLFREIESIKQRLDKMEKWFGKHGVRFTTEK